MEITPDSPLEEKLRKGLVTEREINAPYRRLSKLVIISSVIILGNYVKAIMHHGQPEQGTSTNIESIVEDTQPIIYNK